MNARLEKLIETGELQGVEFDNSVVRTLGYLQSEETLLYYDGLLSSCIRAAIEDSDLFTDEEALDIIRGLHHLRQDLRSLAPSSMAVDDDPTGLEPLSEPSVAEPEGD